MAQDYRLEKYHDRWLVVDEIRGTTIYDVDSWGHGYLYVCVRDNKGNVVDLQSLAIHGEPRVDRANYKVFVIFKADAEAAAPLHRALSKML